MANYRAEAHGNWSSGATWGGGAVPPNAEGHNIYSNGFTVTIDQDVDVARITNVSATTSFVGGGTSAAASGSFAVSSSGRTIKATTFIGPTNASVLVFSAATGNLELFGNVFGGSVNSTGHAVVRVTSGGTLIVNGNVTGGSNFGQSAIIGQSTSQIIVNGNIVGSSFNGNNIAIPYGVGLLNQASLVVNNGTITGSNVSQFNAAVINTGTGTITFNNCVLNAGTAVPAVTNSQASATVTTVNCVHKASSNFAALSSSATLNRLSGTFVFSANGQIPVSASRYYLNTNPTNAYVQFALDGINANSFVRYYTADNNLGQANPTDVRSGVSYASGNLTGTLTVPVRGTISYGVTYGPSMPFTATRSGTTATATLAYSYPYQVGDTFTVSGAFYSDWNGDYTVASVVSGTSITFSVPDTLPASTGAGAVFQTKGTAVLDGASVASAVWSAATRTITGGLVDTATTLTNAPTVPSVVQIRQEMDSNSTKLANLDASVSSRLAPSGTLAVVTTLTNAPTVPSAAAIATQVRTELSSELAKVSALNPTRLSQVTTTEILGNLLSQANS